MLSLSKNKRAWLLGTLILVSGLVASVAVRAAKTDTSALESAIDTTRYVKSIYPPRTFDPKDANDVASISVNNLIYSGLLEFTSDLKLRADLAENFRTSADGRALFFTLRAGLKFHDGSPITTENVVASLSRLMLPSSRVYSYYESIEGAKEFHSGKAKTVKGLVAMSDRDLVIRLRYPFAPFLSILAGATAKVLPITNAKREQKEFFKRPIGAGPFRFIEATKGKITLSRFDGYHGLKPHITILELDLSPQPIALQKAITGEVNDLISWATMSGSEDVFKHGQLVGTPIAETWIFGLNSREKPFDDIRVRRAFRRDFPSEEWRTKFFPDTDRATGYIPPLLPGHLKLSEFQELQNQESRLPAEVSSKPIQIAMIEGLNRSKQMKSFIEKRMKAKGWNVRMVEMPWPKLMEGYNKKTFQSFAVTMNMDYPDPEFLFRNFESTNIDNFSGVKNTKIDRLIAKGRETLNRIERERVYHDLSLLVEKEAVTVEVLYARGHYWLHPCVKGFEPNILSHVYTDYRPIEIDAGCLKEKRI